MNDKTGDNLKPQKISDSIATGTSIVLGAIGLVAGVYIMPTGIDPITTGLAAVGIGVSSFTATKASIAKFGTSKYKSVISSPEPSKAPESKRPQSGSLSQQSFFVDKVNEERDHAQDNTPHR